MKKRSSFSELLSKPMTIKEFLLHLGMVVFAVSGLSSLLKTLADPHIAKNGNRNPTKSGFGGGSYGIS